MTAAPRVTKSAQRVARVSASARQRLSPALGQCASNQHPPASAYGSSDRHGRTASVCVGAVSQMGCAAAASWPIGIGYDVSAIAWDTSVGCSETPLLADTGHGIDGKEAWG